MKVLYIHGFASKFDTANEKVVELSKLGEVIGVTIDYTLSWREVFDKISKVAINEAVDLIVGTSLGGYWAAEVGEDTGIPFVAINPSINPSVTLVRYKGDGVTYFGEKYTLTNEVIESYSNRDFAVDGCGLILLDEGDEVLDANTTYKALDPYYNVVKFNGGSHRFEHINESVELIKNHVSLAELVYGN